ncbi:DUF2252 domain-containing protein [Microbacterium rhizomatis]|uniref:DUF2252 domain-containing protein n=1 Tax=Microbacterium rhizomatis TaxID=1631477 RepID=A0A5J5J1N4_9MICO|nr:DUF2252 domain-containing protein [Microbacterium rhizomatis]KAA9108385.1 DUF2252 domain-containing protein [Microbacterium rhizomatis]
MTDIAPRLLADSWTPPPTLADLLASGREVRATVPRSTLSWHVEAERDPIGILDRQNASRLPQYLPMRAERMSASPFAFYRGTAAIMAADLANDPHTGILVASCGDAHVSNFGFYASPQRTLVFDLNDFDEAAWAPWEWDLKRLVTSIVIAGQSTSRDDAVVRDAALSAVRTYARAMEAGVRLSPLARFYEHFDADARLAGMDPESRRSMSAAMKDAEKRTAERAMRKLTRVTGTGRIAFVEAPPTMVHTDAEIESQLSALLDRYVMTTSVDIRLLLRHYTVSDIVRRVVGVGSVGTRCFLLLLQDGAGNALLLQAKEAVRSVLEEYGHVAQPQAFIDHVAQFGEGGRVVALQHILQAVSDPFLGSLRVTENDTEFYVRQFHDMKGSIEMETLDDIPFARYADVCATTLARAHVQSQTAARVAGYIGNGRVVGESIVEWAYAYADVSRADYALYLEARGITPRETA